MCVCVCVCVITFLCTTLLHLIQLQESPFMSNVISSPPPSHPHNRLYSVTSPPFYTQPAPSSTSSLSSSTSPKRSSMSLSCSLRATTSLMEMVQSWPPCPSSIQRSSYTHHRCKLQWIHVAYSCVPLCVLCAIAIHSAIFSLLSALPLSLTLLPPLHTGTISTSGPWP